MTGDCRKVLRDLPANSVDAIVCDPPYGLATHTTEDIEAALTSWLSRKRHKTKKKGFMGKQWDGFVPGPETWRACRRVLKPGGYVLAFAGTRTMDLMAIAIRLAGFELRDTMQHLHGDCPWVLGWVQSQGFPKNMDIGKAIDKKLKKKRKVVGQRRGQGNIPNDRGKWGLKPNTPVDVTLPASQEPLDWHGYGTNLKPSIEPILLARKPLDGTVAENVLKWGTGGLNIDGCRVGTDTVTINTWDDGSKPFGHGAGHPYTGRQTTGRWPSNVLLQHSPGCRCVGTKQTTTETKHKDAGVNIASSGTVELWECVDGCPVKMLDEQAGVRTSGTLSPSNNVKATTGCAGGSQPNRVKHTFTANTGAVSRFFYCSKASRRERELGLHDFPGRNVNDGRDTSIDNPYQRGDTVRHNTHTTVKPVDLMRYLVRLVTPPDGVVLDPFTGSGTTGVACMLEGFDFLGVEREEEYAEIAKARIRFARRHPRAFRVKTHKAKVTVPTKPKRTLWDR